MKLRSCLLPFLPALVAFCLTILALPVAAQNPPESPKKSSAKEEAEAVEMTDIPEYPDTAEGLEDLMKQMLQFERAGDSKDLAVFAKSLELPNADAWFRSVFGDRVGPQMAQATSRAREKTGRSAASKIASLRKDKLVSVKAVKFTDSCNFSATPEEYPNLLLRQMQEPLYDVRFRDSPQEAPWGFFAYVDGGFRYVGAAQKPELEETRSEPMEAQGRPMKLDANVQAARLIHAVQPDYSGQAKALGMQGNVLLHAVIGKDGRVREVTLLSGVCQLSEAAIHAVQQWRYAPTIVNGEPVEVETTITVVFAVGNHQ